jgi:hypothetical protein
MLRCNDVIMTITLLYQPSAIRYFNGTQYWIERVEELNCIKVSTTPESPTRVLDRVRMLVHETAVQFSTNLEQRLRWRVLLPLSDDSFVDYDSLNAADPAMRFHQDCGMDTAGQVRSRDDLQQWFPCAAQHDVYDVFLSYRGRVDSRAVDGRGSLKVQSLDSRVARAIFDNRRNSSDKADFLDTARFAQHGYHHDTTALTGCLLALVASKVAVPVVSVDALRSLTKSNPEHVDFVLLEWCAMLHLLKLHELGHPVSGVVIKLAKICPIYVSRIDDVDSGWSFTTIAAQLPREVHASTYAALRLFWCNHMRCECPGPEECTPFWVVQGILGCSGFELPTSQIAGGSERVYAPQFLGAAASKWLTDVPLADVNKTAFGRETLCEAAQLDQQPRSAAQLDQLLLAVQSLEDNSEVVQAQAASAKVVQCVEQPRLAPTPKPRLPRRHRDGRDDRVPLGLFVSASPEGVDNVDSSLFDEAVKIRKKCEWFTRQATDAHPFLAEEADDISIELLNVEGKGLSGLFLLFCGHGKHDGLMCKKGGVIPCDEVAKGVAECAPFCVIFNTCDGHNLATTTRSHIPDNGNIIYWDGEVNTAACAEFSWLLLTHFSKAQAESDSARLTKAFRCAWRCVKRSFEGLPPLYLDSSNGVLLRAEPAVSTLPLGKLRLGNTAISCDDAPQQSPPIGFGVCEPRNDGGVRGGNYKGCLNTGGHNWLGSSWRKFFSNNSPTTADTVDKGNFRCFFGHYFDCEAGPSRAYYFESWPKDAPEPVVIMVHIHYWDKPGPDEPGLPKHVNVRRAWRIDVDALRHRAEGHTQDPVPPPQGMSKGDRGTWAKFTAPLVWDLTKNADEERARASAAQQKMLGAIPFCPAISVWNEVNGVCATGGEANVQHKMCMDKPGLDFSANPPTSCVPPPPPPHTHTRTHTPRSSLCEFVMSTFLLFP